MLFLKISFFFFLFLFLTILFLYAPYMDILANTCDFFILIIVVCFLLFGISHFVYLLLFLHLTLRIVPPLLFLVKFFLCCCCYTIKAIRKNKCLVAEKDVTKDFRILCFIKHITRNPVLSFLI